MFLMPFCVTILASTILTLASPFYQLSTVEHVRIERQFLFAEPDEFPSSTIHTIVELDNRIDELSRDMPGYLTYILIAIMALINLIGFAILFCIAYFLHKFGCLREMPRILRWCYRLANMRGAHVIGEVVGAHSDRSEPGIELEPVVSGGRVA